MSSSEDEDQDFECTPSEALKAVDNLRIDLLPEKSREVYWSTYNAFIEWKDANKVNIISENVMLAYFHELANKYKPSTLSTKYSMLRGTIKINHNVKLEDFSQLLAFLKEKSHGYEAKKSNVISLDDVKKFLSDAPDKLYLVTKVALIFGLFGAARHGELCALTNNDVTDHGEIVKVTLMCTKNKTTRNFIVEGEPLGLIKTYRSLRPKNATSDRFFLTYRNGKCHNQPLGKNKFGSMPKEVAKFLQLANPELYTGYAFRKSSATLRAEQGCPMIDLKELGGWKFSTVGDGCIKDSINYRQETSEQITGRIGETSCEDVTFDPELMRSKLQVSAQSATANEQNISDLLSERDDVSLNYAQSTMACKKAWTNLRDSFRRAMRKRKALKSGWPVPTIKKWKFEDEMSFLIPHLQDRELGANLEKDTDDNNDYEENEDNYQAVDNNDDRDDNGENNDGDTDTDDDNDESDCNNPHGEKRRRKTAVNRNSIKHTTRRKGVEFEPEPVLMKYLLGDERNANVKTSQQQDPEPSAIDMFFSSIASTVSNFSPYYQNIAKSRIFNVITDLEMKQIIERQQNQVQSPSTSTQRTSYAPMSTTDTPETLQSYHSRTYDGHSAPSVSPSTIAYPSPSSSHNFANSVPMMYPEEIMIKQE